MRLFVAVTLSDEINDQLRDIQRRLISGHAGLRFTNSFHLTLKFLGECGQGKTEKIIRKLEDIRFSGFTAMLGGIGFFKDASNINVIWAGIENNVELNSLQQKVESALDGMNLKKDFSFHPHVTLARTSFVKDNHGLLNHINGIKMIPMDFAVRKIILFESCLMNGNQEYRAIKEFTGS